MASTTTLTPDEPAGTALQFQSNPPHRILIVDDDNFFRRLNSQVLLRAGYAVDAAEDGAAAWEALGVEAYDLVITDNNMPNVSGVELLEKLHAAHMTLPVIMATGAPPDAEFTKQPWLQPTAMLLKPITAAVMVRTVKKVLREASLG